MTEIREPHFRVDLPGDWEEVESAEEGGFAYREKQGEAKLSVLLLGVKAMFRIADQKRLLDDYMSHRSKFEAGRAPALSQSEPESVEEDALIHGSWAATDLATGRLIRHRVVLANGLLGHFAYEDCGVDESEFAQQAEEVLSSAAVMNE